MRDHACIRKDPGRREFLQTVLSSAVVGVAVQTGIELALPTKLSAQSNLSPDAALQCTIVVTSSRHRSGAKPAISGLNLRSRELFHNASSPAIGDLSVTA
jgi:hypothetical protein